uniref:Uncharacterized protein n=1 Tax=Haemonchus contortus TaxID=6289 RepID=A0A7I4YVS8_HAECO
MGSEVPGFRKTAVKLKLRTSLHELYQNSLPSWSARYRPESPNAVRFVRNLYDTLPMFLSTTTASLRRKGGILVLVPLSLMFSKRLFLRLPQAFTV